MVIENDWSANKKCITFLVYFWKNVSWIEILLILLLSLIVYGVNIGDVTHLLKYFLVYLYCVREGVE